MSAIQTSLGPVSPLLLAPAECRAEVNRTYTQYRYLSGMGSEHSLAVSIQFFIQDHGATVEDANAALKDCRAPERMKEFKFAADLMAWFAGRVVQNRDNRLRLAEMMQRREESNRDRLAAVTGRQAIAGVVDGIGQEFEPPPRTNTDTKCHHRDLRVWRSLVWR